MRYRPAIVVDNRWWRGIIGAAETAKSAPDGYSLGMATVSTVAANPATNLRCPITPRPTSRRSSTSPPPQRDRGAPQLPAKNYKEFVAAPKSPEKYSYFSSSGTGASATRRPSSGKPAGRVRRPHPVFRCRPGASDTVGGQVEIIFDNVPSALPHIQAGRLVAMAVAAPTTHGPCPDVPTFKERRAWSRSTAWPSTASGLKACRARWSTRSTPARKALEDPAVRKRIEDTGSVVIGTTPEQFCAQMKGRARGLPPARGRDRPAQSSTDGRRAGGGGTRPSGHRRRPSGVKGPSNTLQAHRRDLSLFAAWLQAQGVVVDAVQEHELYAAICRAAMPSTRTLRQTAGLTVFRQLPLLAACERRVIADPTLQPAAPASAAQVPDPVRGWTQALLAAPDVVTLLGLRDRTMLS